MLLPLDIILIVNAIFILLLLIGASIMIRQSVNYSRALGDNDLQAAYRGRVIRTVMILFFASLLAAIFNLFLA